MSFTYDREFGLAFAPIAEMMSSAPKLAPGDVDGRRQAIGGFFSALIDRIPDTPDVTATVHHTTASDGHKIAIHHFVKSSASSSGQQTPGPAILYIHGGGMILGAVPEFTKSIAMQVSASSVPFFAVEYRLAPEHPHPTPIEDCFSALTWLRDNAAKLNVDPTRIGVLGESAGGGLAAGTALLARDRDFSPSLAKQILIYPMLDDRNTTPDSALEHLAVWGYDDNVTGWGALLGSKAGQADAGDGSGKGGISYAAPARATSLAGLPDAYIEVGALDIFRDEDIKYSQRLVAAGVMTEFHLYPGVPHAFEAIAPEAAVTKSALANRIRAMQSF